MKAAMPDYKKWREKRYKLFNEKINHFKDHPKYEWLRKYADDAMNANEGFGYMAIKGADFIMRIERMPLWYIEQWLNDKNDLSWNGNLKIFDTHGADSQLNERSGQKVLILRELTPNECDIEEVGKMYHVRFPDGFECDAFEEELKEY